MKEFYVLGIVYLAGILCGAAAIKFITLYNKSDRSNRCINNIEKLTLYNNLTNLPNKISLESMVNAELIAKDNNFNILYIDVDGFKIINETLGYTIGDKVITKIANRIKAVVDKEDKLFHIRGDEFALLITKDESKENLCVLANKILDFMKKSFVIEKQEIRLTSSVGIACYPLDGNNLDLLLKNANIAVQRAKESGKNKIEIYDHSMNVKMNKKLKLINNLHKAIENEEFTLHYQPQVNSLNGEIVGLEALIRWESPELGIVSPGEFIPLAEETGLIIPIGDWVLKAACNQAKIWQESGNINVPISINISTLQFLEDSFIDKVIDALNEADLEPKWIHLEITESVALKNAEFTMRTLDRLQEIGIKVALDDFGTGFSSLEYLNKFNIDILKIDTSFIRVIGQEDTTVTNSIIVLGKSLNMSIIAEGVETDYQLNYLKETGCDVVQGYLFSRPVPSYEIEKMLKVA